jgi:hypothetical protein
MYDMNVNKYKKYLEEIQLFECKSIDPFKEQGLKGNYVFGYFENTDQLQNEALASLPDISKKGIVQNLIKLKQARAEFLKIDRIYEGLLQQSKTEEITIDYLKKQLSPFELTSADINSIDGFFLNVLHDTILYRLHSLLDLINKTEDYLTEKGFNQFHLSTEKSPI